MDITRIHRLLRLITVMQSGTSRSAAELAEELGVSRRTLFRDLSALKTAGVPYQHDEEHGFRIEPSFFLPPVNLKINETLGLMLLARSAEDSRSQPLYQSAIDAVRKLAATLPAPYREVAADLMLNVSVRGGAVSQVQQDADHFAAFQKAIDQRRICRMRYDSLFDKQRIEIAMHPYHLHWAVRAWYVIGYSVKHKQVRMFKLARIVSLNVTGKSFKQSRGFDIHKHLGNAWSLIPEGREYAIELDFSPKVATNVSEVRWHHTQEHELLEDGRCRMRFTIDGLGEITWWLLGYGDQVYVRKPAALRKRLAAVHQAAAERLLADGEPTW